MVAVRHRKLAIGWLGYDSEQKVLNACHQLKINLIESGEALQDVPLTLAIVWAYYHAENTDLSFA